MGTNFLTMEDWFLASAAIDYVALDEIANRDLERKELAPSKKEFEFALSFIKYLFNKYGNYLTYSTGPGDPINKTPKELLAWLKSEYDAGKYEDIYYGVWFSLDKKVIPSKYIPTLPT